MSTTSTEIYDVAILGGGLAGLSLALQCKQELPLLRIAVLEKNRHPAPEAAFKVGESTVELATHYFTRVLGLEQHMQEEQLSKLGLRFFFRAGDNTAIERRLELGGRDFPPKPSYQLDRGRLENFLGKKCRSLGISFIEGATITDVELRSRKQNHSVSFRLGEQRDSLETRWVADCSGRAAILKRKLGLDKEATHRANAAWFRVAAEIKIDDWSDDPEWSQKYDPAVNPRWLSTNHLMGDGYWVWLIPLASGCTSVGIVADEGLHPLAGFNSLEKALAWLEAHEPQCAEKIREQQTKIQDFIAIKRYSRECKQVFSANRWGITGEAGFFLDPFYSPGSDFIALGNTYLCELIRRDQLGKSNRLHAPIFDQLYKQMHYGTAPVYQDQYALWGDQQIMPIKILWDYMVYWTLSGHVFCHGKSTTLSMFARHLLKIRRISNLNRFMQKFFREWHAQTKYWESTGEIDAWEMPLIIETNRALLDELDTQAYAERFAHHVAQMETLFWEIIDHAGIECKIPFRRRQHPQAMQGSFERLFEATRRRLDATVQVDQVQAALRPTGVPAQPQGA